MAQTFEVNQDNPQNFCSFQFFKSMCSVFSLWLYFPHLKITLRDGMIRV